MKSTWKVSFNLDPAIELEEVKILWNLQKAKLPFNVDESLTQNHSGFPEPTKRS